MRVVGGGAKRQRRVRLDRLLVERGLSPSRERARGVILAGQVFVGGRRVDKAGALVDPGVEVEVRSDPIPYVSRGGVKLAAALDAFGVDPAGRVCLDAGASTGGFTDCLLRRGARLVYAVDVGYGQLAWTLRQDPRVVAIERCNVRHLDWPGLRRRAAAAGGRPDPARPDLATIDVSFISLEKVLPAVSRLLAPPGTVVALVKPQFEVGRGRVGRGGVVRDPALHREVLERVCAAAVRLGYRVRDVAASPLLGPEGNREFLAHLELAPPGEQAAAVADLAARLDRAVAGSGGTSPEQG